MFQRIASTGPAGPVFHTALLAALIGFGMFFDHIARVGPAPTLTVAALQSDLTREQASPDVERLASWAVESQDHAGLPFIVIDSDGARLFAFDAAGRLLASAPVLPVAGHADGPAARPAAPAGRFVSDGWPPGEGITWIGGDAALSLHRAPAGTSADSPGDRRAPGGLLQVADNFYTSYLQPLKGQASIAYVLPQGASGRKAFDAHRERGVAQVKRQPARRPS